MAFCILAQALRGASICHDVKLRTCAVNRSNGPGPASLSMAGVTFQKKKSMAGVMPPYNSKKNPTTSSHDVHAFNRSH